MDLRPEGASLTTEYSMTPGSTFSVSLHLKGTWETQNHQTFCMRLVLVSLIYSYMSIIIETLHDQYFSLTPSKTPNHVPEDQGTVMTSQCMKIVLVSFTLFHTINLLSTCTLMPLLSFTLMFARGTCAS